MDKVFLAIGGYLVSAIVFKFDPLGLFSAGGLFAHTITGTPASTLPTVTTPTTNTTVNNNTSVNPTGSNTGGTVATNTTNTTFNAANWQSGFLNKLSAAVAAMGYNLSSAPRFNIHQWNDLVRGQGVTNLPSPEEMGVGNGSYLATASEYYQFMINVVNMDNSYSHLSGLGNAYGARFVSPMPGRHMTKVSNASSSANPVEKMLITRF